MKRVISYIIIFSFFVFVVAPIGEARGMSVNDRTFDISTEYIVKCDNVDQYKKIKNEFENKNCIVINHNKEDEVFLEDTNSMVVKLNVNEVKKLKSDSKITVEENDILAASSNMNKCIPVPILYENKSEEFSDNPKEFIPCKPIKNKKKKTEIVPWNIKSVTKNPYKNKYKGAGVKVAVIDSGIDMHDDLNTKEWIDFSDKVNGYKPIDSSGHGTGIAGVIAARDNGMGILGIASEAELYSIRVLDEGNKTSISNVIKAIEWCIDNDIDIINMSFGMNGYSSILEDIVDKAYDRGIIMISASGNNTDCVQYPAAFDNVVSVGSINKELRASVFSKNNNKTDLVAPGEDIYTLDYLGRYCTTSGTSIAAAHTTGIVAAIMSKYRNMSVDELKDILISSAVTLSDGSRMVNYDNAVKIGKTNRSSMGKRDVLEVIETTDDNVMEASWASNNWHNRDFEKGSGHLSLINKMPLSYFGNSTETSTQKKKNRDMTADAAWRTDIMEWTSASDYLGSCGRDENGRIDTSKPECLSPYHAKSEYDFGEINSHSLFLYELARRRLILNKGLAFNTDNFQGNMYCGVYIPQKMARRIIVDLGAMYDQQCYLYGNNYCKSIIRHKGYMILGVFLHLIQDIQAHRAKFTLNMLFANADGTSYYIQDNFASNESDSRINGGNIKGVSNGDYSTYWSLYNTIKQHGGSIPMIRLKDFLNEPITINCNNKSITCNKASSAYEDNPLFYGERYNGAYFISCQYIDRINGDTANDSKELGSYLINPKVSLFLDKY